MKVLQTTVSILLALVLPGIASYFIVQRVFFPPLAYIIDGPKVADISVDSPSALMPVEGPGAATPGMRGGATGDSAAPNADIASRSGGNNADRPAGSAAAREGRQNATDQRGSFTLMRLFTSIGRLEQEGTATLSVAQAKSILALMNPLRKQAKLTPAQALTVKNKLQGLLTKAQLAEIEQLTPPRNGNGPRNGGAPGAGNAPPDGSSRPAPPEGMEDMNPFNPNSDNPMAQRIAERMDEVFQLLAEKAAQ